MVACTWRQCYNSIVTRAQWNMCWVCPTRVLLVCHNSKYCDVCPTAPLHEFGACVPRQHVTLCQLHVISTAKGAHYQDYCSVIFLQVVQLPLLIGATINNLTSIINVCKHLFLLLQVAVCTEDDTEKCYKHVYDEVYMQWAPHVPCWRQQLKMGAKTIILAKVRLKSKKFCQGSAGPRPSNATELAFLLDMAPWKCQTYPGCILPRCQSDVAPKVQDCKLYLCSWRSTLPLTL